MPLNFEISNGITFDVIENIICNFCNVKKDELQNQKKLSDYRKGRYQENEQITITRQICHYLSRKYIANITFKEIGERFGRRDSTTTQHSCVVIQDMRKTNSEFNLFINLIETEIKKDEINFNAIPQY
ncbi:MAG: helix-turn-helix domain-containing protein [Thiohalospira sp.]